MRTHDSEGRLHSLNDQPARVYWGISEWYKHGKLHRDGGLPTVVTDRGQKEWWVDIGPAVVRTTGVCSWYRNGLHVETL